MILICLPLVALVETGSVVADPVVHFGPVETWSLANYLFIYLLKCVTGL